MRALLLFVFLAGPCLAETCRIDFDLSFDEQIGSLAAETPLIGTAEFTTLAPLRQPGNGLSFTTDGQVTISAPDDSVLTAGIVDMHISRTEGSLDYVSFNARRATGELGGLLIDANPILATWYGPHGTLRGDAFPAASEWEDLTKRRALQMRLVGNGRY